VTIKSKFAIHSFSREIARDFIDKVRMEVDSGGTGILPDEEIETAAHQVWDRHGIGDYFPGNLMEGRLATPGAMDAVIAGATWWMPWVEIEGPKIYPIDNDASYTAPIGLPDPSADNP
jgi:hypothetical protein